MRRSFLSYHSSDQAAERLTATIERKHPASRVFISVDLGQ
jgi:hypothetical protein